MEEQKSIDFKLTQSPLESQHPAYPDSPRDDISD